MEEKSESSNTAHIENINLEQTKEILTHNDNTAAKILTSHQEKDVEEIDHEATKKGIESTKKEVQSTTSRTHSETKCSEDEGPPASGEQLDLNNPPQDKDEIKDDPLGEKSLEENTNLDQSRINEIHESEDPVSSESMVLKSQQENLAETAEDEGEMTDYCVVTAEEVMEDEKSLQVTESTGASLETLHSFRPELGGASLDETQLHNLLNRDDVKVEYSQQEKIDLLCDNVQKDTIEATEVSSESINNSQPSSNETFSDNDATSKLETTDASNDKSDFSKLEPTDALNETTDATKGDSDSLKDNSDTAEQETDTIYKHNDDTVQQETGVYLNNAGISHLQKSDIALHSTSCAETSKSSLSQDNFIDNTNLETGNMSSDNTLNASSDIIFGTSKPSISDNISSISEHPLNSTDVCLHKEKCSAENNDTLSSSTETEAQLEDISLVPNEEQVLDDSLNSSAPRHHNTELSAAGINVDPVSEATETSTKLECLSETIDTAENFKVATSVLPQDKGQSTPPLGFSNDSNEFPESASETNLTPDIGTEVAADEPPLDETINRNISENIINKGESIVTSEDTKNEHITTSISKEEEECGGSDHFLSLDQDVASADFAALPASIDGVSLPTKDNIEHEQDSHLYESLDQEAGLEDAAIPKSCSELNSANVEHKDDHFQPLDEDTGKLNTIPKSFHLIAEPQSKETPDSCATNSKGTINDSANNDEDSFGKVAAEQQDIMRNTDIKADRKAGCSGMSLTRAFLQFGVVTLFGVGSAAVVPIALAAAGFEAGGIAAGSVAEYLMTLTSSAGFGMSIVTLLEDAGTASLGLIPQVFVGFLSAAAAGGVVLTSGLFRGKKQSASVSNGVTAAKERKTDLSTSTVSKEDYRLLSTAMSSQRGNKGEKKSNKNSENASASTGPKQDSPKGTLSDPRTKSPLAAEMPKETKPRDGKGESSDIHKCTDMAKSSLDNRTIDNGLAGSKEIQIERNWLKDKNFDNRDNSDRSKDINYTLVKKNKSHGNADLGNALLLKNKSTKYKYSDNKDSDNKDSDNKDSDNKDSDNKDSNSKDSDNKDSDNKDSENKDSDNKDSDNKDSDNKDSENKDKESTENIGDQKCESNENNNNGNAPVMKPETPTIRENRNTYQTPENFNGVSSEPIGNENSTNRTEESRIIVSNFFMSTLVSSLILSFVLTVVLRWLLTALGFPPSGMLHKTYAASLMSRAQRPGFAMKLVASLQSWVTGDIEMYVTIVLAVALVSFALALVIPNRGGRRGGARGRAQERN